uniref:Uncharacterized protein n=1 Tax=Anopheles darlingi TaxID=43151 RepID=A0A2M4DEA6_ANODA
MEPILIRSRLPVVVVMVVVNSALSKVAININITMVIASSHQQHHPLSLCCCFHLITVIIILVQWQHQGEYAGSISMMYKHPPKTMIEKKGNLNLIAVPPRGLPFGCDD